MCWIAPVRNLCQDLRTTSTTQLPPCLPHTCTYTYIATNEAATSKWVIQPTWNSTGRHHMTEHCQPQPIIEWILKYSICIFGSRLPTPLSKCCNNSSSSCSSKSVDLSSSEPGATIQKHSKFRWKMQTNLQAVPSQQLHLTHQRGQHLQRRKKWFIPKPFCMHICHLDN